MQRLLWFIATQGYSSQLAKLQLKNSWGYALARQFFILEYCALAIIISTLGLNIIELISTCLFLAFLPCCIVAKNKIPLSPLLWWLNVYPNLYFLLIKEISLNFLALFLSSISHHPRLTTNKLGFIYGLLENIMDWRWIGFYFYPSPFSITPVEGKGFYNLQKQEHLARFYVQDYEKHQPKLNSNEPKWEGASLNPIPDLATGQQLIDSAYESLEKHNQLFNLYNGKIIKCRSSNDSYWHCYEVYQQIEKEIGTEILRDFLKDGLITKKEYKKLLKQ